MIFTHSAVQLFLSTYASVPLIYRSELRLRNQPLRQSRKHLAVSLSLLSRILCTKHAIPHSILQKEILFLLVATNCPSHWVPLRLLVALTSATVGVPRGFWHASPIHLYH